MSASPLSLNGTWDLVAEHYEREVMPVFHTFAREALALAGLRRGMRVVDVAAGPGTLAVLAAEGGATVDALDFSPRMVEILERRVDAQRLRERIVPVVGDGMALPYADGTFDAGFSMFGLMFFPDRGKGFRELLRVLAPGARAVVASWLPMNQLPLMSAASAELWSLTAPPGTEPPPMVFPLSTAESCREEMAAAGFVEVEVHERTGESEFADVRAMLASFGRSSAPFALAKRGLGERWGAIEETICERLTERFGGGPQSITLHAYLTVGVRK